MKEQKLNFILFMRGETYESTKRNIAEIMKKNNIKVDDIISVDYMNKMIWYKDEVK